MMKPWTERVEQYLDQLQESVDEVDSILEETNVDSTRENPAVLQQLTERLYEQLEVLEQKVHARDGLLRAEDAPESGMTLTEKLSHANQPQLAQRADLVARRIADVHGQSMSIFVCQFHLSNLTSDLVRMLTGAEQTTTYGGVQADVSTPQGGLFNESA
jgi:septation ring formation regulator EzrA